MAALVLSESKGKCREAPAFIGEFESRPIPIKPLSPDCTRMSSRLYHARTV